MNAQFGDYERVLVRNNNNEPWTPNFYGYYDYSKNDHVCMNGKHYSDCILYDKYKELSGTVQDVEYRNISHEEFKKEEDIEYIDFNGKRYRGKFFKQYDSTVAIILDCDDNYLKIPYSNIRKVKFEASKIKKDPEFVKDSTDWKTIAYLLAERLKNNSNDIYDKNSSVEDLVNSYKDFLQYDKYSTYERLGFRSMADFFQNAIDRNNADIKEANRVCQKYSKEFIISHDDDGNLIKVYCFGDNSKLLIKTFNNTEYDTKVYPANGRKSLLKMIIENNMKGDSE